LAIKSCDITTPYLARAYAPALFTNIAYKKFSYLPDFICHYLPQC
jgi:hypothetical protein